MIITLHIISKNYTELKKNKIYYEDYNIDNLLDNLLKKNIIDNKDYKIYYNNQEIKILPKLDTYDITLVEQTYKSCSCCKNNHNI